jgi:hypothetical protein
MVGILAEVKATSDARGQIAHANPVQSTSMRVRVRRENGKIVESLGLDGPPESIDGCSASRPKSWCINDLAREYDRIDKLFIEMVHFVNDVGTGPPA